MLASSAGGVYATSRASPPFDEQSPVGALSPYGREKLIQEELFAALSETAELNVLIGRFSNLYGPGQYTRKPQGLVAHIGVAALRRQPVVIYVPLDTIVTSLLRTPDVWLSSRLPGWRRDGGPGSLGCSQRSSPPRWIQRSPPFSASGVAFSDTLRSWPSPRVRPTDCSRHCFRFGLGCERPGTADTAAARSRCHTTRPTGPNAEGGRLPVEMSACIRAATVDRAAGPSTVIRRVGLRRDRAPRRQPIRAAGA